MSANQSPERFQSATKLVNSCNECLADDTRPCICPVRFGCKTIGSEETTPGNYFDEETGVQIAPRTVFASQDWAEIELQALFDFALEYEADVSRKLDISSVLTVSLDTWAMRAGKWTKVKEGRSGVQCLVDFLSPQFNIIPNDLKRYVCRFLVGVNPIYPKPMNHSSLLVGDVRRKYIEVAMQIMISDQNRFSHDLNLWDFSSLHLGLRSYCLRCGEYDDLRRSCLLRFGVCTSCGTAGLQYDRKLEYHPFTGLPTPIQGFPVHSRFRCILATEVNSPFYDFFIGLNPMQTLCENLRTIGNFYHIEWPALEHPEWFAKESLVY